MDTDVLEDVKTDNQVSNDDGDHERFAHYITKFAQERFFLHGTPATALCGKTWLPTKDPAKFPVCPDCKAVWEGMAGGSE